MTAGLLVYQNTQKKYNKKSYHERDSFWKVSLSRMLAEFFHRKIPFTPSIQQWNRNLIQYILRSRMHSCTRYAEREKRTTRNDKKNVIIARRTAPKKIFELEIQFIEFILVIYRQLGPLDYICLSVYYLALPSYLTGKYVWVVNNRTNDCYQHDDSRNIARTSMRRTCSRNGQKACVWMLGSSSKLLCYWVQKRVLSSKEHFVSVSNKVRRLFHIDTILVQFSPERQNEIY